MSKKKPFNLRYLAGPVYRFSKAAEFKKFIEEGVAFANTVEGLPTVSIEIVGEPLNVLAEMNECNRPFNKANASRLLVDMADGRFKHSADPILISDSGIVLSAANRIGAARVYGKPVRFNITFGMTFEDSLICLDRQSSRTPGQILQYTRGLTKKVAATCRMFQFAPAVHEHVNTTVESEEMTQVALQPVLAAFEMLKGCPAKLLSATLVACVARAIPHAKKETLAHFCDIFRKGPDYRVHHNYEKGPLKLREAILSDPPKGSRHSRQVGYMRVQEALLTFIRQKERQEVPTTTPIDCFPLVGKAKAAYTKWAKRHAAAKIPTEIVDDMNKNRRGVPKPTKKVVVAKTTKQVIVAKPTKRKDRAAKITDNVIVMKTPKKRSRSTTLRVVSA